MNSLKTLLVGVAVSLSCASALAYPGQHGHPNGAHPGYSHGQGHADRDGSSVWERSRHQDRSIRHGVATRQLTPHEAYRLERQQARIRHEARQARADGWISPYERERLERMQDRAGRHIRHERHDWQGY
ncbi:MAG: hypothetical protein V4739_00780 [Pseudomonadota bacterium]